jgi:DNA-directed RNA polymerase subunit RPC12/RpoP
MLKKNIPTPKDGYEEGNCPTCDSKVWITPQAKLLMKTSPELRFACTECALKEGLSKRVI